MARATGMDGAAQHPFAALLRSSREAAGLTQAVLAERAGLSVPGLRYLEQGARRPYPDTLLSWSKRLSTPCCPALDLYAADHTGDGADEPVPSADDLRV